MWTSLDLETLWDSTGIEKKVYAQESNHDEKHIIYDESNQSNDIYFDLHHILEKHNDKVSK